MPHEYFAPQPTPTIELPDPVPLLRSLTHGVLEVLAGVREIDQLARWFSEEAFRSLVTRSNLSARARSARGVPPARPTFEIRALRVTEPSTVSSKPWWWSRVPVEPGRSRCAWKGRIVAGARLRWRFSEACDRRLVRCQPSAISPMPRDS